MTKIMFQEMDAQVAVKLSHYGFVMDFHQYVVFVETLLLKFLTKTVMMEIYSSKMGALQHAKQNQDGLVLDFPHFANLLVVMDKFSFRKNVMTEIPYQVMAAHLIAKLS